MKKMIFIHISFIDCFPRLGMKREKEILKTTTITLANTVFITHAPLMTKKTMTKINIQLVYNSLIFIFSCMYDANCSSELNSAQHVFRSCRTQHMTRLATLHEGRIINGIIGIGHSTREAKNAQGSTCSGLFQRLDLFLQELYVVYGFVQHRSRVHFGPTRN